MLEDVLASYCLGVGVLFKEYNCLCVGVLFKEHNCLGVGVLFKEHNCLGVGVLFKEYNCLGVGILFKGHNCLVVYKYDVCKLGLNIFGIPKQNKVVRYCVPLSQVQISAVSCQLGSNSTIVVLQPHMLSC